MVQIPPKGLPITACRPPKPLPGPSPPAYLLEAAGAAAAATVQGAEQAQHLTIPGVHHAHTQGPPGAAAQTRTAAALLRCLTQGLSRPRAQFIPVTGLPAQERCQG